MTSWWTARWSRSWARQTSFARLQRRLGVRDPGPELCRAVPVYFYLFDVLRADGRTSGTCRCASASGSCGDLSPSRGPLRFTTHRKPTARPTARTRAAGTGRA